MVAAYCCFRQSDTGELSDFPRNGNLDTAPPPIRSPVASRMGWASGLRLQGGVWSEELSDAVDTKTRQRECGKS